MHTHAFKALWFCIAISALCVSAYGFRFAPADAPLETVAHVDLGRYAGKWYEIARYPNRFEAHCDRDVTAEYSKQPNGTIRVVNACIKRDGQEKKAVGSARVVDLATNAKLKVTFFWLFSGDYWILAVGDDYEYAVVGEPSRKYLWILSRTSQISQDRYRDITSSLASLGYDASRLVENKSVIRQTN